MRRPQRQTGIAAYEGAVVQQGARIMLAASPGQVRSRPSYALASLRFFSGSFDFHFLDLLPLRRCFSMAVSPLATSGCRLMCSKQPWTTASRCSRFLLIVLSVFLWVCVCVRARAL
jgi:hypothetical protein